MEENEPKIFCEYHAQLELWPWTTKRPNCLDRLSGRFADGVRRISVKRKSKFLSV